MLKMSEIRGGGAGPSGSVRGERPTAAATPGPIEREVEKRVAATMLQYRCGRAEAMRKVFAADDLLRKCYVEETQKTAGKRGSK